MNVRALLNPTGIIFLLCLLAITVLFPYYWALSTALKPATELLLSPPKWVPGSITFDHFKSAWIRFSVPRYLVNSILVSGITAVASVLVASMAGYSLSRIRVKGSVVVVTVLLVSQLLPGVATIIPFYFWMMQLGLVNTRLGLILAYTAWAVPFCTLMLRSYFQNATPMEIEESAMIDGCTRWGAFWRVVWPLSIPGIIATTSYAFVLAWNEFMWASIMLSRDELKTLPVALRDMIGEAGNVVYISEFMATSVISTIPVLVLYFVAQRYIVSGLTAGAVKG